MKAYKNKKHYIFTKAWQRSSVGHHVKSRCRHARLLKNKGHRYRGGR